MKSVQVLADYIGIWKIADFDLVYFPSDKIVIYLKENFVGGERYGRG